MSWEQIDRIFGEAAELPASERAGWLDFHCADPAIRREVESLLESVKGSTVAISGVVSSEAADYVSSDPGGGSLAGQRFGAWQAGRILGKGGMGTVYLAERADDSFHKQAALKVIRAGLDEEDFARRFRHEREILAQLDHPYIARLLDGGRRDDGQPWLVMEYVPGLPIDEYCSGNGLNIRERCRLFLKVCEAVSYAHRNLVVHRDLKPGNILVTAEGTPKLLDFGIARLMSAGPETIALPMLTPDYASPEQVNGSAVTTAADVYALGAVLYALLTGTTAHRFTTRAFDEVKRLVCETDVERPSLRAAVKSGELKGDLDNIVLTAMRREPERRYASVDALHEDVARYLSARPVMARGRSFGYLASRYLRRHALATAAIIAVAVSLTGTSIVAVEKAREALNERDAARRQQEMAEQQRVIAEREHAEADRQRGEAEFQKTTADTERRLAEHRFEETREMAGKFLFDFHDSIAALTGATPARKLAVDTGIRYYDSLMREAAGNRDLLEEIARGYDRLGDVQGNIYYSNLGDVPGAEASYRKALAIRSTIVDSSPAFLRDRIQGNLKMGELLLGKNNYAGAVQYLRLAIALGSDSRAVKSAELGELMGRAWSRLGDAVANTGAKGEAIEPFTRMLAVRKDIAGEAGNNAGAQRDLALARTKLAEIYWVTGRPVESVEPLRLALDTLGKLVAAEPGNMVAIRNLCIANNNAARVLHAVAGPVPALAIEVASEMRTCTGLADKMVAADPDNRRALFDLAVIDVEYGDWLHREKDNQGAADVWNHGMAAAQRLVKLSKAGIAGNEQIFIELQQRMAVILIDAERYQDALDSLTKADEYAASVEEGTPDSLIRAILRAEIARTRVDVHVAAKQWRTAAGEINVIIGADEAMAKRDPKNQMPSNDETDKYALLAQCYVADGQRASAVRAMQTAVDRYTAITVQRPLDPGENEKRREYAARLADWRKD